MANPEKARASFLRPLKRNRIIDRPADAPAVSVVIPMYNEEENLPETIDRVAAMLERYPAWEIVAVDDGSVDLTLERLEEIRDRRPELCIVSYPGNRGRGYALRRGFGAARGAIIVTLDSDLSYDEHHIPQLVDALHEDHGLDVVLGSIYAPGGKVEGVSPWHYREVLSRIGNKMLSRALPQRIATMTCILRAYRRQAIRSIDLASDGKEIHLEILAKLLAVGAKVKEIPATAIARSRGASKFNLADVVRSHLLFAFFSKPASMFGAAGGGLLASGLFLGLYFLLIREQLNPDRPLVTLMVVLLLAGLQVFFFGFIASQIVVLQREIYRVQRQNLQLKDQVEELGAAGWPGKLSK